LVVISDAENNLVRPLILNHPAHEFIGALDSIGDVIDIEHLSFYRLAVTLGLPAGKPVGQRTRQPELSVRRDHPSLPGATEIVRVDRKPSPVRHRVSAGEFDRNQDADARADPLYLHQDIVAPGKSRTILLGNSENGLRDCETNVTVVLIEEATAGRARG
jgi:hypothetical protein